MTKRTKARQKPKEIEFDFIKSNYFRVIKADGAFGGITGNGSIHMALYSERNAIPTKVVHAVVDGSLGPELRDRRQGRKAIVREVEVDVMLDITQAMALSKWLDEKIKQFSEIFGTLPQVSVAVEQENGKGKRK